MSDAIPVLLIDDLESEHIPLAEALLAFGYVLDWAPELEQAVERLLHCDYATILVDRRFEEAANPADRGLEIIRELKRRFPEQEMILLTNFFEAESAVEAIQHGAFSAVRKGKLEKIIDEIQNTILKKKLSATGIDGDRLRSFLNDPDFRAFCLDLRRDPSSAEDLLQVAYLVKLLAALESLSPETLAVFFASSSIAARLPGLAGLSMDALESLADFSRDLITLATRDRVAHVLASPDSLVRTKEELLKQTLAKQWLAQVREKVDEDKRFAFFENLLRVDGGVLPLTVRLIAQSLLNCLDDSALACLNTPRLIQLQAAKYLPRTEGIVHQLRSRADSEPWQREIAIIERLTEANRRYSYLSDIRELSWNGRDWLQTFAESIVPLLADQRGFFQAQESVAECAKSVQNIQILADRFNQKFIDFVWDDKQGYRAWCDEGRASARPLMTIDVVPQLVLPALKRFRKVLLLVFDGMSLLSWHRIRDKLIGRLFETVQDGAAFAVIPTATYFARSAIFAGQLPRYYIHAGPQKSLSEHDLLGRTLQRHHTGIEILKRDFMKFEEGQDQESNNQKRRQLRALLDSKTRCGAVIFDPHDKVTHIAPGFAEDFAELFFAKSIYPVLEEIAALPDTAIVITSDHGFCPIRHLTSVRVIFAGTNHRQSDFKYSADRTHFGKRYIDLGDRTYVPRHADPWVRCIDDPIAWGLPNSNGFLIAVGDRGFSIDEGDVRMFAHGGVSMEEMIVPAVVMATKR